MFQHIELPVVKSRFNSFKKLIDRIENIRCLEKKLGSPKLGVAGTVDCVAEFNKKLSIIDFKTSRKRKCAEWIKKYFAQTTAYSIMMYETYNLKINQLVILISVDNDTPQIFITRPSLHIDYLREQIINYKGSVV